MAHCLMCSSHISENAIRYHLANMGFEIIRATELQIGHEVDIDGELCESCFANVLENTYTTSESETPILHDHVCVWCRSSLFSRRSHSISEGPQRDIIANQIAPRMINEGALACFACWVRAGNIAQSQNIENEARPNINTNICVLCQLSLSTRRSHALPDGLERTYILTAISPREIPRGGRVCWNCWRIAQRHSRRSVERNNNECAWCLQSLTRRQYRLLRTEVEREELLARISPRQIPTTPRVCLNCWRNILNNTQLQENDQAEIIQTTTTMQFHNYKKTVNTAAHCFVPECVNSQIHTVPDFLRKHIFSTKKILVSELCRVCEEHRTLYDWDILDQFEFSNVFSQPEIEQMLELNTLNNSNKVPIDFENINNYQDNVVKYWTSVTKSQFFNILHEIPSLNEMTKRPKTALGVFLVKVRTGDSHERIASLFLMSKGTLINMLKKSREALKNEFVPLHIGFSHLNRDDLVRRNLLIPQGLFGEENQRAPIVICDGSYIYVQKSSNYLFQKKTYSLHKYKNLVKPFLIVACDGHIVDVQGPYAATDSDADIMKALFQDEDGQYRNFFRANDIFILDRGFRDALPLLNSLNYKVYKPESVDPNETQLSTLKANKSRNVTLCRWVVEIVNGRFKRDYKLFRQDFFNLAAGHLFDDFKICAALINAFHPTLNNRPDAQAILERAQLRFNMPNNLADYIIQNNINRHRAHFVRIDGNHPELDIFPQMTMSDLILFSLGTYQIKQARSYYGEHIRRNGSFEVEVSNQLEIMNVQRQSSSHEGLLLRGRIKSRHQSSKVYYTYLTINSSQQNWEQAIPEYYCSCVCGKRTVGCCSHVMTIVWYLGWARHQTNIEPPASFLDDILIVEDD